MGTRIEIGDPLQYAEVASQILQAAWKPPCLLYSPDYLRWQFSFPSDIPKRAAIAVLDERPAGFIAVTARHFSSAQQKFAAYVLSFVAVDPSASRRGLAAAMYTSLLDAIPREIPVFAFAEPASIGETVLLKSFARASFRHHLLLNCRAAGYLHRSKTAAPAAAFALEATAYQEFASAGRPSGSGDIIWTDVTREHWQHYRQDPRERVMLAVRDAAGNPLGTAMLVTAEIVSSEGVRKVPILEGVALAEPTSDALAALFGFAAERFLPGATVVASNVSYIDNAIINAAGARALPSSFNAHVFIRGEKNIVEGAAALNLEVI